MCIPCRYSTFSSLRDGPRRDDHFLWLIHLHSLSTSTSNNPRCSVRTEVLRIHTPRYQRAHSEHRLGSGGGPFPLGIKGRWREKGEGDWQRSLKKKKCLKLWGVCVGYFLGSLQFNQWDKLKLGTFATKCRQQSCRFSRMTLDKKLCNGNSKDAEVQCFCLLPQVPPHCLHRNRISDYQL